MREMSESDAKELYDEMLDEVHEDFMKYPASQILKEVDPIAYDVGFADWTDAEGIEVL